MKALVFNGPRDVRYESYPDPELATDNSVIVKVERCSICGSDLHMYHGDNVGTANYSEGVDPFALAMSSRAKLLRWGNRFTVTK